MSTIYALTGISGSGKTTLARTMVRYMNAVIIGRDPIREMLFGYTPETIGAYYDLPDFNAKENLISKFQDSAINTAISKGQDVILDNTHLKLSYLNDLKKYGVANQLVISNRILIDLAQLPEGMTPEQAMKYMQSTGIMFANDRYVKVEAPWQDGFLRYLQEKYVYDQDSQFCKNKVPEEGICVRKEGLSIEVFKLKSFRFLEGETKQLDKGEIDTETAN